MSVKMYIKAIKALPRRFVKDETRIAIYADKAVIATNPNYPAIIYTETMGWVLFDMKGIK